MAHTSSRRGFLKGSAALMAAAPFQSLFARHARGQATRAAVPLLDAVDGATGLKLIRLPEGFEYVSFGWTRDPMSDGRLTPGTHDGMAVVRSSGPVVTLIRNHEIRGRGTSFGPPELTYDPRGRGGNTNLHFHTGSRQVLESYVSLAGTSTNCAGGPTPWGSWLTCEETLDVYDKTHGWTFEVHVDPAANPLPLRDMGRFVKEAVAVDPQTGVIYETEDRGTSGFYRYSDKNLGAYKPRSKGHGAGLSPLSGEGALEMLAIKGKPQADFIGEAAVGSLWPVEWVPIADPERAHSPGTTDSLGVFRQGRALGGAQFSRLEGTWAGNGVIYFVSTSGGPASEGQVWAYDPVSLTLELLYVSPDEETLDNPDNIAVSPRGGLVLCEDGDRDGQRMQALSSDGTLIPFAVNNVVLNGEKNGFSGNFVGSEWAGATFSPDGKWLFANIQSPGISFAITGPWESIGL